MGDEERFDGMLLNMAQQQQGIEPLLTTVFSFLRRKTDFFTGTDKASYEAMVMKTLHTQAALAEKDAFEKEKKRKAEEKKREKAKADRLKKQAEEAAKTKTTSGSDVMEVGSDGAFDLGDAGVTGGSSSAVPESDSKSEKSPKEEKAAGSGDGDDDEDDKEPPPLGNGGNAMWGEQAMTWTQTLQELDVAVSLPPGIKSKHLTVELKASKIKVILKPKTVIKEAAFHKKIKPDDSTWTLEDGHLKMYLTKDNQMEWWKNVVEGDPEINTQKVQPENSKLSDLDGDTRQTVEKMMFDQQAKAMGKPTSDELKKQEMLEKFMKQHPEMDFSKAKIN